MHCSEQHKPCPLLRKFTLGPCSGCHLVPRDRSEPSRCTTSCLPVPFPVTLLLALTLFLGYFYAPRCSETNILLRDL